MKTSSVDLVTTAQPVLWELDENDLFAVAGGQYPTATASNIANFALATGDGGKVTLSGNTLTATAGNGGFAVLAGFIGSLSYSFS